MRIGSVSELWRYPVKSMGGERLPSTTVSSRGLPGDRGWALYDEQRQGITGAKRLPPLRHCRARYTSEPQPGAASPQAEISFPDGSRATTDSPEAARKLGELTGRALALRALGAAGSAVDPRLTLAGESPQTVRALMGLLPGEPEADMSAFPAERLRELRQGNFFDAHTLHMLTRTSLRSLARLAPESDWDERRFRPNLLLETDETQGFPELDWLGRRLRIGDALIEVVTGCPRCVMVTLAGDGLPEDRGIMRTLVRETRHLAGIYASVLEPGLVREGARVELLD